MTWFGPTPVGGSRLAASRSRSRSEIHPFFGPDEVLVTHFDGSAYQARFDQLEQSGISVHGEVDFIMRYAPVRVLDAGCGTGRVAIELARRGVEAVGVDSNPSMLKEAQRRSPSQRWIQADLAVLDLGEEFDVVVLAGNVPLFCPPADRPALVASCARHVAPGGRLVAGFQLDGSYSLGDWDEGCRAAGLEMVERWAAWETIDLQGSDSYAVSVFARPS
jgi:SAM-dependent methyltransferase